VAAIGSALIVPGGAAAAEPAEPFNAPGQRHANVCVRLAVVPAALRFGDGVATGFSIDDQRTFDEDGRCPNGTVRLDLHELIPAEGMSLAFHRGGNGYVGGQNVKYGHLPTGDVADILPPPVPSSGGRGAPCGQLEDTAYEAEVRSIPEAMHYKRPEDLPSGSNRGTSWEHYGDPGADQGSRKDIHYSYLLWSFPNVRGGGMVRTLLVPDHPVRACDVEPVTMHAWDRAGAVNGRVTARYVRVLAGTCPLYGWMVWSHDYFGDPAPPVAHALPTGAPPPAEPPPNPECPVSPPGVPPIATTDEGVARADGSAVLAGRINPNGVNTTYHFELGTTEEYGAGTEEASTSSADRPLSVTATVTGLRPETTYHFRLVASTTHGTSYGENRTLTTPAPAAPVAAGPVIELSRLRVAPATFRRARTRRRAPARIRYVLSAPGSVTLTFFRRAIGVRRRGACRKPPPRGAPRGRRRCARWVRAGRSLRHDSAAGTTATRFGGWIGRRPLPRGRYRVEGTAAAEGWRPGPRRRGYFRLR
jgi:hypothetical protein